jgi:hypothetical protein
VILPNKELVGVKKEIDESSKKVIGLSLQDMLDHELK